MAENVAVRSCCNISSHAIAGMLATTSVSIIISHLPVILSQWRTRLSSELSDAAEAEPALEDSSDSDDTDAAMLATGTATPPDTATPPSATNQVSVHSADVNSARQTCSSQSNLFIHCIASRCDLQASAAPWQRHDLQIMPRISCTPSIDA